MALTPERRSEIMLTNISESDCGVIAIQAVAGVSRERAERLCKEHGSYEPNRGTPRGGLERVLDYLGVEFVEVEDYYNATPATLACEHPYGSYLVYVERHVMALVDGDLHNSRGHWRTPVDGLTRLVGR